MTLLVCCKNCGIEELAFKRTAKDPLGKFIEERAIDRREDTLRMLFDVEGPHYCAKCGHELALKVREE